MYGERLSVRWSSIALPPKRRTGRKQQAGWIRGNTERTQSSSRRPGFAAESRTEAAHLASNRGTSTNAKTQHLAPRYAALHSETLDGYTAHQNSRDERTARLLSKDRGCRCVADTAAGETYASEWPPSWLRFASTSPALGWELTVTGDRAARRPIAQMGGSARVVIADDQYLVRAGIGSSLSRAARPRYEVVAEAGDAAAMVAAVEQRLPDLLILDVVMRAHSALEALEHCIKRQPNLAAVVLTTHVEPSVVREAIRLGALGYFSKTPSQLS